MRFQSEGEEVPLSLRFLLRRCWQPRTSVNKKMDRRPRQQISTAHRYRSEVHTHTHTHTHAHSLRSTATPHYAVQPEYTNTHSCLKRCEMKQMWEGEPGVVPETKRSTPSLLPSSTMRRTVEEGTIHSTVTLTVRAHSLTLGNAVIGIN